MGGSPSVDLQYIQTVDDKNFGLVEILQPKQNPAQFIMKYKHVFFDAPNFANQRAFSSKIGELRHRVLAKLYFSETTKETIVCTPTQSIYSYYSYYNRTLLEVCKKRLLHNSPFPQTELWYIMHGLLDMGHYLEKNQLAIENFSMRKLFVTPSGFLKVYPIEIQTDHKHSNYYRPVVNLTDRLLSPEQLALLRQKQYSIIYDVYKSDVFSIGIMMLQLMTLDQGLFYDHDNLEINTGKIQFTLRDLSETYSRQLLLFVQRLLLVDCRVRWSFAEGLDQLNGIRHELQVGKSIGVDISSKRKSQSLSSILQDTDFNLKLVAAPIKFLTTKERMSKLIPGKEN